MQFLRLPSGRGVNIGNINSYSPLVSNENNTRVVMLYRCNDGVNETIEDADARALYAWLTANSTSIGEDGREVGTVDKEPSISLSAIVARKVFLASECKRTKEIAERTNAIFDWEHYRSNYDRYVEIAELCDIVEAESDVK